MENCRTKRCGCHQKDEYKVYFAHYCLQFLFSSVSIKKHCQVVTLIQRKNSAIFFLVLST